MYIVANDALAARRAAQWRARFESLGKRVEELGDDAAANVRLLKTADVVVTTARRWDVVSRRWRQRKAVQTVRLVLVDQLQLIGGADG